MSDSISAISPQVIVDAQHPWLGLLPFKEAHKDHFFGRDAEITEILERIQENTLTILFGQSGLGKSSLMGAGVLPRLTASGSAPVLLRLDYDPALPSLLEQTRSALRQIVPALPNVPVGISLWELFHRQPSILPVDAPEPVIIFDQFEEIFTLGRQDPAREAEAAEWLEQMSDLLQNRPPKSLENRFAENRRLARDYDFGRCPLRVVFAMREDYLSYLEQWKTRLPLLTQNRMVLHLLDGPQALEAVLGPASLAENPLLSREVAASIVRTVARVPSDTPLNRIKAVPPLLSLLCEQLNAARLVSSATEITADMVSSQSADILQRFYEESYAVFPEAHQEIIREIVEDRMVTIGGHRHPVAREDAEAELSARGVTHPRDVIDSLITHRLLTAEEHGGIQRLEITHDVLVPLLVRSRKERRDRVAKELAERKLAEEKALTRKRRQLLAGAGLLTLLAIAGAIYGLASSQEAKRQRDEARYNEGLGWMLRAEVAAERHNQYPDTLLYAAQAIGFDGVGRLPEAPDSLLRFIRQERNPEAYAAARKWISDRPAYLPVWSSAPYPSKVTCMDVSPEGRWLAIGTADGSVRLWDFSKGSESVIIAPGSSPVLDMAFHPWGTRLDIVTSKNLRHWDLRKAELGADDQNSITSIAWSPSGTICAASPRDGTIHLWDNNKMTVLSTGHNESVSSLSFSADNSAFAAVISGVGVRIVFPRYTEMANAWSQLDEKQIDLLNAADRPAFLSLARYVRQTNAVAMRPDGQVIVTGGADGTIGLWKSSSAKLIGQASQQDRHQAAVLSLAFRPDGWQFASASADGTIRLWSTSQENVPTIVATLLGHCGEVAALKYLPGGDLLASAGTDGSARIWNVSGEKAGSQDMYAYMNRRWFEFEVNSGQFVRSAGGFGFANVPSDSVVGIWSSASKRVFAHLMNKGEWNGAANVFTPDEKPILANALLSDAQDAAKNNSWNRVDLRLRQMDRIQSGEGAALKLAQQAIAVEGKPIQNTEGIKLLWCEPGTFHMGGVNGPGTPAKHKVTITQGFWLGKYETTQAQWAAVMSNSPSTYSVPDPRAPLENVSWEEAVEFCHRLTDQERVRGTIPPGWEYALPTEAQWEYACRAGSATTYGFGDNPGDLYQYGNFNDKSGGFTNSDQQHDDGNKYTALVGSYKPNNWGFFDMHGNVSEWCRDSIASSEENPSSFDMVDPAGINGGLRAFRGGGFYDSAQYNTSAFHSVVRPTYRNDYVGFRPALIRSLKSNNTSSGR